MRAVLPHILGQTKCRCDTEFRKELWKMHQMYSKLTHSSHSFPLYTASFCPSASVPGWLWTSGPDPMIMGEDRAGKHGSCSSCHRNQCQTSTLSGLTQGNSSLRLIPSLAPEHQTSESLSRFLMQHNIKSRGHYPHSYWRLPHTSEKSLFCPGRRSFATSWASGWVRLSSLSTN